MFVFCFLHVAVLLLQHHLLKKLSFICWIAFISLSKSVGHICVRPILGSLFWSTLMCLSSCQHHTVLNFYKLRFPTLFFFRILCSYFRACASLYRLNVSISTKNVSGNLVGIALNPSINLRRTRTFTILSSNS